MLSPKRMKFRKYHRGKMRGLVSLCFKYFLIINCNILFLVLCICSFNYFKIKFNIPWIKFFLVNMRVRHDYIYYI